MINLIIDDKNEIFTYKDGAKLIVDKLELSSKINELYLVKDIDVREKLLRTLEEAYRKAPFHLPHPNNE